MKLASAMTRKMSTIGIWRVLLRPDVSRRLLPFLGRNSVSLMLLLAILIVHLSALLVGILGTGGLVPRSETWGWVFSSTDCLVLLFLFYLLTCTFALPFLFQLGGPWFGVCIYETPRDVLCCIALRRLYTTSACEFSFSVCRWLFSHLESLLFVTLCFGGWFCCFLSF